MISTADDSSQEYYRAGSRGMLPVRWTAVEALEDSKFSEASDVWAWGITMVNVVHTCVTLMTAD